MLDIYERRFTVSIRAFIVTVGIALLALGLVLGLRGHSLDMQGVNDQPVTCGSAFSPDDYYAKLADRSADFGAALAGRNEDNTAAQDQCAAATSSAGIAWALIIGGVIAALGGFVVNRTVKPGGPTVAA